MGEEETRVIFGQLLSAVQYCHLKGIIHCDLKTENVVFADETKKKIKVIDFGVSGIFKNEKVNAGSLQYMAPEIIGKWNIDSMPQIDIWSLGCILYEMITGHPMFSGQKEEMKV
jgi:serine/threonine protein kinase